MRSIRRQAFWTPVLIIVGVLTLVDLSCLFFIGEKFLIAVLFSVAALPIAITFSYIHAASVVKPLKELTPKRDTSGQLVLGERSGAQTAELEDLARALSELAEEQSEEREARIKLERVRSEFLGNVSHELRTPIFAIQGFIETLLDGAIDDPAVNRDFLTRARVQSERLNSLLNDLIDISRIESGEMRMSFRSVDIQPFLREFVAEMQPIAKQKSIDLYFTGNILPHHEVTVFADKERLKQVLVNLVDNAIKYSEANTSIKLELVNEEPTASEVTIRVVDRGVGIASAHIPRLFERFYRVDKGRARSSPGGTGLGLAIVKHIIEAHKGRIRVTSEVGKGSTFQFTLRKDPF
jgi:two-component system phosphate regulon sensor histidine kinase PhoR